MPLTELCYLGRRFFFILETMIIYHWKSESPQQHQYKANVMGIPVKIMRLAQRTYGLVLGGAQCRLTRRSTYAACAYQFATLAYNCLLPREILIRPQTMEISFTAVHPNPDFQPMRMGHARFPANEKRNNNIKTFIHNKTEVKYQNSSILKVHILDW